MGRRTMQPADVDLSRTWGTVLNDRRLVDRYLGRGVPGARFLKRIEVRLGTPRRALLGAHLAFCGNATVRASPGGRVHLIGRVRRISGPLFSADEVWRRTRGGAGLGISYARLQRYMGGTDRPISLYHVDRISRCRWLGWDYSLNNAGFLPAVATSGARCGSQRFWIRNVKGGAACCRGAHDPGGWVCRLHAWLVCLAWTRGSSIPLGLRLLLREACGSSGARAGGSSGPRSPRLAPFFGDASCRQPAWAGPEPARPL